MGKFLRVLVFILLALCIGALVLGILLFNKRELLKGRAQRLEKAIKEFDAVIEAEPGTMDTVPSDPEKDISPCQAEIPEPLEYNDFWKKYNYNAEVQNPKSMVSTSSRDAELMTYFIKDAAGNKRIKGPGTMDGVLTDLLKQAETQYNLLNTTRQQLADLRKELISTIKDFNEKKNDHRQALIKIKGLEEQITRLEAKIAELENKIAELEAQITPLKDQIAEQERKIAEQEELITEKNRELETLKKNLGETAKSNSGDVKVWQGQMEAGIKGTVLLVNREWQFVIFQLEDQFLQELIGKNPDAEIPQLDLWVKRPDKAATIVTKIRMLQVRKSEKLATADVLTEWQQMPLQEGDLVFFE